MTDKSSKCKKCNGLKEIIATDKKGREVMVDDKPVIITCPLCNGFGRTRP